MAATSRLYTNIKIREATWLGLATSVSKNTPLGVVQCGHLCRKSEKNGSPCNAFRFQDQVKSCTFGVLNVI